MALEDVLQRMRDELATLEREFKLELPRRIQAARELGDISENSEFDSAKDRQGFLHARISFLRKRINELQSINLKAIPRDRVGFGSTVHLEDEVTGEEKVYRLVAAEEMDSRKGWISVASPVGRALLGKQVGDRVAIQTPGGAKRYEVTRLVTLHEDLKVNGGGKA